MLFEKFLQGLNGPGVKSAGPALRLTDFGTGLLEGLVLKVVTLQKLSLFFGQMLNGRPDPPFELLHLQTLIGWYCVIADLKAFSALKTRGEDHRQAGHGR